MNERELCIALNMISGVGFTRYTALKNCFGTPDDIRGAGRGDLQGVSGVGPVLAERIAGFDWDAELTRELAVAERGNVKIVTLADADYPEILRNLSDPPLVLYIRGELPEDAERSVAIVGSRRISNYGKVMAKKLAQEAVEAGFTVFSGLAYGVDSTVHQSVVELGGRTVGVVGGGLLHLYPKENIPLAREMVNNGGAVVSEFPLNFPVSRHNFPRRNRIVAAMCRATLVVEAGLQSGALITARLAAEMGREVFAVPGRVDNPQAAGCHRLIREGAELIESFADVSFALQTGLRPGMLDEKSGRIVGEESLSPEAVAVLNIIKSQDADLEDLQHATGMTPGILLGVITELELKNLVERDAGFYYHFTGTVEHFSAGDADLFQD